MIDKIGNAIQPFDIKNISHIVECVKPRWSAPSWEDSFRNFYAERIIRDNYFKNGLTFQLVCKDSKLQKELLAIIFFQKKFDKNNVDEWILQKTKELNITDEQKISLKMCTDFLEHMESKVHALMSDEDIKLSLFVALKKGSGKILFEELWQKLKKDGYKNMYLWTDCECNWEWYIKNGFTLIEESVYEKFSQLDGEEYKTYVFKKEF